MKIVNQRRRKCTRAFLALGLAVIFLLSPLMKDSARAQETESIPSYVFQENTGIWLSLDGQKLAMGKDMPVIVNNRVLLPLRLIFEAMGAEVNWDNTSKTVTAQRHEDTLHLTLNSKIALKNGEELPLDVPALAHNDRVYVPVRFIGESFGSQVEYISQQKLVQIRTDGRIAREQRNLQVYVNGNLLTFDAPPILLKGTQYLPLDELLDAIAEILPTRDNFRWKKDEEEFYHLYFDRVEKSFTLADTSKLSYKPIMYQDIPYTPFRLVEELLGGQVYRDAAGVVHIYINRITLKHPFVPLADPPAFIPQPIPEAAMEGERLLMVSDNPENLTPKSVPTENATLWLSHPVKEKDSSEHRVFGWHVNKLGTDARIGVVIENTGKKALEIHNALSYARASGNIWGGYDVGLPLADAVVSGLMVRTIPAGTSIAPGESLLLEEHALADEHLLGFVNDFDIRAAAGDSVEYQVRVVVSILEDQDLAAIKSDPLSLDKSNPHPRGNWEAAAIKATVPRYHAGDIQACYSLSNGSSDNLYNEENALENGFTILANPGHFGASYILEIPVYNAGDTPRQISFRLSARGGQYTGALKNPDGVFLIPNLIAAGETAELYTYAAPPGESTVTLELFHAGGSSLAVALNIVTLD